MMNKRPYKTFKSQRPVQSTPLGDGRFQELLSQASTFFSNAERDTVKEREDVIAEIKQLMAEYGLTAEDLSDE